MATEVVTLAAEVDWAPCSSLPGDHRISHDPRARGQIKRGGAIDMDGFWVCFSRTHPDGQRLSQVLENGLLAIQRSGEHDHLLTAFKQAPQP